MNEREKRRLDIFESFYASMGDGDILAGLQKAQLMFYKLTFEDYANNVETPRVMQDVCMDAMAYADTLKALILEHEI